MGYDHREINHQWFTEFREKEMTVDIDMGDEMITIPVYYEVCDVCDGKGRHVNPSIDHNGLTADDFGEHDGFYEDYISGVYDVDCVCCHGRRVVPAPNYGVMHPNLKKRIEDYIADFFQSERDMHREREMGY